jgi:hypothetical protein
MNEELSPKNLLRIKLAIKKKTKDDEKTRKKEKIIVKLKRTIGCTKNIKINNLPSAPPITFKINSKRDMENTNIRIKIFKKIIITRKSRNKKSSKKFMVIPKI